MESIAPMIGCVPQTLHECVERAEIDAGEREGLTTSERERFKALECENKELQGRRASAASRPGGRRERCSSGGVGWVFVRPFLIPDQFEFTSV